MLEKIAKEYRREFKVIFFIFVPIIFIFTLLLGNIIVGRLFESRFTLDLEGIIVVGLPTYILCVIVGYREFQKKKPKEESRNQASAAKAENPGKSLERSKYKGFGYLKITDLIIFIILSICLFLSIMGMPYTFSLGLFLEIIAIVYLVIKIRKKQISFAPILLAVILAITGLILEIMAFRPSV